MSLKTNTTDLSAIIKTKLALVDGEINDTVAYEDSLPEGLDLDTVKSVRSHDKAYVPAFTHAAQAVVFDAMKADSEVTSVKATTDLHGGDSFSATINRSRSFPVPGEKDKSTVTVYGATSVSYASAAGKNAGELKKVLSAGKEQFAALAEK